ncbi:Uncharacterised protein [Enterobacter kobei]|nr:Uncharacterised protein [Enterobacter kobei]
MSLFKAYHQGELIPEDNAGQRARIIQTYFRLLVKQGDYLSKLSENQREIFTFTLPRLSDDSILEKSTLHREVSQEQNIKEVENSCLHQKFYFLRDFVERRKLQINRLQQEIDKALYCLNNLQNVPFYLSIQNLLLWKIGQSRHIPTGLKSGMRCYETST